MTGQGLRGRIFLMRFCCFLIVFAIFDIFTPDYIGDPWSNSQSMDPRFREDDKRGNRPDHATG